MTFVHLHAKRALTLVGRLAGLRREAASALTAAGLGPVEYRVESAGRVDAISNVAGPPDDAHQVAAHARTACAASPPGLAARGPAGCDDDRGSGEVIGGSQALAGDLGLADALRLPGESPAVLASVESDS